MFAGPKRKPWGEVSCQKLGLRHASSVLPFHVISSLLAISLLGLLSPWSYLSLSYYLNYVFSVSAVLTLWARAHFLWGTVLCMAGCLAASLAGLCSLDASKPPSHLHPLLWLPIMSSDIATCPPGCRRREKKKSLRLETLWSEFCLNISLTMAFRPRWWWRFLFNPRLAPLEGQVSATCLGGS